jgi:hypothetical protein
MLEFMVDSRALYAVGFLFIIAFAKYRVRQ